MSERDICSKCGQMYSLHVGPCPPEGVEVKYPLLSKWLPGLVVERGSTLRADFIYAALLERELEKAVVVRGFKDYSDMAWISNGSVSCSHEALLLSPRPLRQPRTKTLSEDEIRTALKHGWMDVCPEPGGYFSIAEQTHDEIIDKLFGKE